MSNERFDITTGRSTGNGRVPRHTEQVGDAGECADRGGFPWKEAAILTPILAACVLGLVLMVSDCHQNLNKSLATIVEREKKAEAKCLPAGTAVTVGGVAGTVLSHSGFMHKVLIPGNPPTVIEADLPALVVMKEKM